MTRTSNTPTRVFFALLLLLILAACGLKEDEAVPPTISYITHTDDELGITLDHPDGWVTHSGYGGLTIASSQEVIDGDSLADMGDNGFALIIPGEIGIFNKQTSQEFTKEDTLSVLGVYKQLLEREGQNHEEIEPAKSITINGQPAAMMVTRSQENGKNLIILLTVIMTDDYLALVSAASLEPTADEMRPIFEQMIKSIQIASPY